MRMGKICKFCGKRIRHFVHGQTKYHKECYVILKARRNRKHLKRFKCVVCGKKCYGIRCNKHRKIKGGKYLGCWKKDPRNKSRGK